MLVYPYRLQSFVPLWWLKGSHSSHHISRLWDLYSFLQRAKTQKDEARQAQPKTFDLMGVDELLGIVHLTFQCSKLELDLKKVSPVSFKQ